MLRPTYHEIDWAETLALVIACLQVLIVALLLAGRATRRAWDALPEASERLGRWYSRLLVGAPGITQRIDRASLAFALDEPEDEAPGYIEQRHASRRTMSPPRAVREIQLWTCRDLEQLTDAYADASAACGVCPHRQIPLSAGRDMGNGVRQCPGHGLCWDREGRLVRREVVA